MKFSEETLMAYADNELDAKTRAAVEEAMATDPEVARKIAQHKALRGKVHLAFNNVVREPTPQRLIDAARGVPAVRREGNVIPLRRKTPTSRAWPQWAAIAASLVIGIIIGQAVLRGSASSGAVTSRDGQLLANGVLARALSEQLASTQTDQNPVRIGLSFKSKAGNYCRTFTLHESTTLSGLACRDHDDWHIQTLAQTTPTPENSAAYRQPAAEMPKSILQAVEDNISGEALDATAETAAREKNWTL